MKTNPWESIKKPVSDFNARRADPEHPFEFFWAKDVSGDYLFVFQCDPVNKLPDRFPELKGISTRKFSNIAGTSGIVLKLQEIENWDIFYSLCQDLLSASLKSISEDGVIAVLINRLIRWHEFLRKSKPRTLTEHEQKGLLGELLYLRDQLLPNYRVSDALTFWKGPEDASQDFNIGNNAVEIKAQSGTSKPHIRISSVEQLSTQLSRLYLVVYTLGSCSAEDDDRINLPLLIKQIESYIEEHDSEQIDVLQDLLFKAGYIGLPEYSEFNFVLNNCQAFEVKEDFPRINPSDIADGITKISYDIILDKCLPYTVDIQSTIRIDGDNNA